jgi:hypothetical protein
MLWRATVNPDRYLLRRNGFWLLRRDLNLQSGLITKLAENPFKERGPAYEVDAPALFGRFSGAGDGNRTCIQNFGIFGRGSGGVV